MLLSIFSWYYICIVIFFLDLIRPRDTYQFFVEQHGLKVFKTLDTAVFSTGKLILGPYEEKGKQHVGQDILVSIFLHLFLEVQLIFFSPMMR